MLHFAAACFPYARKVVSEGRPVMSWGICVFVDVTVSKGEFRGKGRREGGERGSIEQRGEYRRGREEMKERRVEEGGAESTGGTSRLSVGITR